MKVELLEFKRCCFCVPLRYGLLTWGYIRLAISLLLFILVTSHLVLTIKWLSYYGVADSVGEGIEAFIFFLIILLDLCLSIVFLVGGHRKTAKLLRVSYIYSIVILCITTLLAVITSTQELYHIIHYSYHKTPPHWFIIIATIAKVKLIILVLNFAIQSYVILLLKSEIKKLTNDCSFRFQNVAMEAECTLENGSNENGNGNTELDNGTTEQKNVTNVQENGTDETENRCYGRYDESGGESFNYKKFVHN